MLKYAGIEIGGVPDPDGRLAEMLRQWWHQEGIRDFDHPGYYVAGIDHLPIPAAPIRRCPQLHTLIWPNGASRWGEFHALITKSQLDRIYEAVDPVQPERAKLEILPSSSVAGRSLSVSPMMHMLPPRVIGRHSGYEMYLLSLVDKRFYWWQRVAAAPAAPASWTDLIDALLTSVGEPTPSIGTIPSDYGTPNADRWNVGYKPLPLLIDAACATVGMRLVLQIGGVDVVVHHPVSALAVMETAWNVYKDEILLGGRATLADLAVGLPETVRVVFPGDTPSTKDKLLNTLGTAWDTDFSGVVDAVAFVGADMAATAADADRELYATQAAADYYEWCNSPVDATFRGLAGWTPTGLEDRIEWVHERDRVVTRVFRRPAHDRSVYGSQDTSEAIESILVTSLTTTDGRYPGVIQDYDVESKTWSNRTGGTCWITEKNGGNLELQRYEDCKRRGFLAADGLPVFTALMDGVKFELGTDVYDIARHGTGGPVPTLQFCGKFKLTGVSPADDASLPHKLKIENPTVAFAMSKSITAGDGDPPSATETEYDTHGIVSGDGIQVPVGYAGIWHLNASGGPAGRQAALTNYGIGDGSGGLYDGIVVYFISIPTGYSSGLSGSEHIQYGELPTGDSPYGSSLSVHAGCVAVDVYLAEGATVGPELQIFGPCDWPGSWRFSGHFVGPAHPDTTGLRFP